LRPIAAIISSKDTLLMRMPMLATALMLALGASSGVALAAPATTAPGQVYTIKTTMLPTGVVIAKDRFTRKDGTPSWPRGATIRYSITNKTTKTLALKLWIATTKPIAPGGHTNVLINWIYRGRFLYQELDGKKLVGAPHYLVIGETG
jgi:hypothetical protein